MEPANFPVLRTNWSKLSQPQLRIMLEYMGYSHVVKLKKPDRIRMLAEVCAQNPERAQMAFDIVVKHKLPETASNKTIEEVQNIFYQMLGRLKEDVQFDHIQRLAEELKKDLSAMAKTALSEAAKDHRPLVVHTGKKKITVKGVLPPEFTRMVQLAAQRVPIYMVGPAGCGKTFLAGKIAEALGFDRDTQYADQSMSEGISESHLTGWLLPTGKSGQFEYVESPFVRIYENGGVFLFDELDASDSNLMVFMNKAIANDGFYVPQRKDKPFVKKHPDFIAVAAANTYGTGADAVYVGRNQLDAATLDRFRAGMIQLDYASNVEEALIDSEILAWGREIRKQIQRNSMNQIMSTRNMLDLTRMKANEGWSKKDWETAYFLNWTRSELNTIGRQDLTARATS